MSFGGGAARVATAAPCPCGSDASFGACCGPLLAGAPPPSAEQLMRSRYTAFVLGDEDHLTRTWHPRTRPESVSIDPALCWLRLEVLAATEHGDHATVDFRAHWVEDPTRGVLAEHSRFERRAGRWFYVDGDVV